MSILAFDCETTGLLQAETAPMGLQPFIIEICCIRMDDDCNVEKVYNQMFKPPIVFEEQNAKGKGITQITGISNAMLADKKPFIAHWKEVADMFLGCKVMVAHNVSYDRGCLYYELRRIEKLLHFPWPYEHHCTIEQSMHLDGKRQSLSRLHETLFGEKFEGAHRAEADVQAMIRCYKKLNRKGEYVNG